MKDFGVSKFRQLVFTSCLMFAVTNLMDFTDTVIAGHLLNECALGALGLFWPCVELGFFVSTAVANGATLLYSKSAGEFNSTKANGYFTNGLVLSVVAGVALSSFLFLARESIFSYLSVGEETLAYLRPYWNCYMFELLIFPTSVFIINFAYSDGWQQRCVAGMIVEVVANIVASFFLCRAWGVVGCALGTIGGTVAGTSIVLSGYFSKDSPYRLRRGLSFARIVEIFFADLPSAAASLFACVVYLFMDKVILMKFGENLLPVMTVIIAANGLALFLHGIPNAARPIVGIYFGEGNTPTVRRVMRSAVNISVVCGAVLSALLIAFPNLPVMALGITEPELMRSASLAVRLVSGCYLFVALVQLFVAYYLFIYRSKMSFAMVVLYEVIMPILGCMIGGEIAGYNGFWVGYAMAAPLTLVIFFGTLFFTRERRDLPFLLSRDREAKLFFWHIKAEPAGICSVTEAIQAKLEEHGATMKQTVRSAMLVEDMLMAIRERNGDREVEAEVILDMNKGVSLVFRDDGISFNAVASEGEDFRARVMSSTMKGLARRNNLNAIGFNRNACVL